VAIINLDPANERPPYHADIDLGQLVTLQVRAEQYVAAMGSMGFSFIHILILAGGHGDLWSWS